MKNINKIVIFDWGGIIESHREGEYNIREAIKDLMKKFNCKLSDQEIIDIYSSCSILNDNTSIGTYNDDSKTIEWFNNVKSKLNLDCSIDEFIQAYYEDYKKIYYYKDVVKYAHSLKDICNTAIFSNLMKLDGKRINDQVNLSMFDYVFLSYELGYRKPDVEAYEKVEKALKINPNNILFIDDTKENIEMAKQRGWNTCHSYGYELDKIKQSVNKFLDDVTMI